MAGSILRFQRPFRLLWAAFAAAILLCAVVASRPAQGSTPAVVASPAAAAHAPLADPAPAAAAGVELPPPAPIRPAEALAERVIPAAAPSAPAGGSTSSGAAAASGGSSQLGYGCAAAIAYLQANAAPGFTFECPGYSYGHQAMTCVNHAPQCPGQRLIAITVPCPAAYENEAHNSWVLIGARSGGIDPYGYCH